MQNYHRSAQALQFTQSRSCLLFGTTVGKLSTLHDSIRGDQVGSQGTQRVPLSRTKIYIVRSLGKFFSKYGAALDFLKSAYPLAPSL